MNLRVSIIQKLIAINETLFFYPKLAKFYSSSFKINKPIIFDVGANMGQSIIFFKKIYPNAIFHAFEPNKNLFDKLKNNFPNLIINNIGISDKNGFLTFNKNLMHETSTFEQVNQSSDYLKKKAKILGVNTYELIKEKIEVPVSSLREYIINNKISRIDILKIDTEGHEYKCLKGLFPIPDSCDVDIIQLENHEDDMYSSEKTFENIKSLLLANHYEEITRIPHGFGDFSEVIFKKKQT